MVEKPVLLSGPIRMEGMHFAGKNKEFCVQTIKGWMENSHKYEAKYFKIDYLRLILQVAFS